MKKKRHAHARPKPKKTVKKVRKKQHKHRWRVNPDIAPKAFVEGGKTRYWVYYICTRRGCPSPVKAEKEPKPSGKPWWRR